MKKIFSLLLALSLLLGCSVSVAETGIQLIPDTEDADYISLDDVKLNVPAQAEDLFTFTATSFEYVDCLWYYYEGYTSTVNHNDRARYISGADEEYALLRADIMNEQMSEIDFTKETTVIAVYDERYNYTGEIHQYNYNLNP